MRGLRGLYSPARAWSYIFLAFLCAAPRLIVLLHERAAITASFAEKSDKFAQLFISNGTYGLLPGQPSAYTQPLYGWFLIPVYWLFGREWLAIGIAQILLAVVTVWLVYETGRRVLAPGAAVLAAAIATLNPYLIWHDIHMNREITDQVAATALVLLTLLVAERATWPRGLGLGLISGLAMLGNTRLVFVPLLCAAYLAVRLPRTRATALVCTAVLAGAAVAVAPWLIRNKANVGCFTLTTDGRAMWKANNARTYALLSHGKWIDDVGPNPPRPPAPGHVTPEEARGLFDKSNGRVLLHPDECLEMTYYENLAFHYWRKHPGGKLKLAALSTKLLWQPSVFETTERPGAGSRLDVGRRVVEPVYMWALYAFAVVGLVVAPRYFAALAVLLLLYQTAAAWAFVGATRYRVAWDFLLALLAAATVQFVWERRRAR